MKWFAPAFLLSLTAPPSAQETQEDQVFIDEIHKDFLERIRKAEEARDWPALFAKVDEAHRKHSQKLVSHPERPELRISLIEWLLLRMSSLPAEALEFYRAEHDARAKLAFDEVLEEGDPAKIQRTLWTYFLASSTDEVLDRLGDRCYDAGQFNHAAVYWTWLLKYYPDSGIPKTVTAAKIAVACRAGGSRSGLEALRQHVSKVKLDGEVLVGRDKMRLSSFLETIRIDSRSSNAGAISVRSPSVPEPEDRHARRIIGVRNDIRRWVYDFAADKGETGSKPDTSERPMGRRIVRFEGSGVVVASAPDFPYLPAQARIGGRHFVIATNGLRVVAFDPAGVKGESLVSGVYWKFPERGAVPYTPLVNSYQGYYSFSLPYIGATVEGEHAFVTLYSERYVREQNPNSMDLFDGPRRLVCIHIPSGQVVWDTDRMEAAFRQYDFVDRNFAYSAPPIVRGRFLYAGLGTSPLGEEESRVLCLDRATGRPLWCTTISSVSGGGRNLLYGSGQKVPAHLTLLSEEGGVLYAQTSLGTVAAIDGLSGSIRWLATYRRAARKITYNQQEPLVLRPANPPLLYRGVMYLLPQDAYELMAFHLATGIRADLPPAKVHDRDVSWRTITHLIGVVDDWMILGGSESYVVRMSDFRAYGLPLVNTSRSGLGTLIGETAYLPAWNDAGGELAIYHGAGSWKQLAQAKWKGKDECGNLLVAGDFLIVASNRIVVYTDTERLRQEYIARVRQTPQDLPTLFEYGCIMRENDKLEDAAEAYLEFVRGAEGDPKWEAKVRQVRVELYAIFLRRGDDADKSPDPDAAERALKHYQRARDFSYDLATWAEATRKIAATHERLRQWKDAVAEYQNLLRRSKDRTHRKEATNSFETLWLHARKKIAEIMEKDSEAYAVIEKEAGEALRKIADGDIDALRSLRELYPNSKAAREAWQKMYDALFKKGMWNKLRGLLEEFKSWYGKESGFEHRLKTIDFLDRVGDVDRLVRELELLRESYPDESVLTEGVSERVADFVERRLGECSRRPRSENLPIREPIVRIAEMDALAPPQGAGGLAVGYVPLEPLGILPPDFPKSHELFRRGSAVELWDLSARRCVWSRPHPGRYVGFVYQESELSDLPCLSVIEVRPGSPAELAGLQKGDSIVEVAGRTATPEALEEALRRSGPLSLRWIRENRSTGAELSVESWPVGLRPAIVGSAFTRDHELAVAWEDGVASIELSTGRVLWFFGAVRERFHLADLQTTDGRLYATELYRGDRSGTPLRVFPAPKNGEPVLEASEALQRLICLDDFAGRVLWIRGFEIHTNGQGNGALALHSRYFGDRMAVVETGNRGSASDAVLWVLDVETGEPATGTNPASLTGVAPVYAIDPEFTTLYYIDVRDNSNRVLRSIGLNPAKPAKAVEVALGQKYMEPGAVMMQVLLGPEILCLVSATAAGSGRVWVLGRDGKEIREIPIPADRSIPNIPGGVATLEGGILYLYTHLKSEQSGSLPPGFLAAVCPDSNDKEGLLLWEAVAPSIASGGRGIPRIDSRMKDLVLFVASRGAVPRENSEFPIATIYSPRDGGYLRMLFTDLSPLAGIDSVIHRRGRLFVNLRGGLQIYGNAE